MSSAKVAGNNDVTESDDSMTGTTVELDGLVHRRNSRVTTPGKVSNKEARVPEARAA